MDPVKKESNNGTSPGSAQQPTSYTNSGNHGNREEFTTASGNRESYSTSSSGNRDQTYPTDVPCSTPAATGGDAALGSMEEFVVDRIIT